MTRVVIAQCVKDKWADGMAAKDLYKSDYFKKQRAYAEAAADVWFIQSGEYGLLEPDEFAPAYDTHVSDLDDPEKWGRDIALEMDDKIEFPATVELLGGEQYAGPLRSPLRALGYDVREPLKGLGIGERKAELDRLRRQAENEVIA